MKDAKMMPADMLRKMLVGECEKLKTLCECEIDRIEHELDTLTGCTEYVADAICQGEENIEEYRDLVDMCNEIKKNHLYVPEYIGHEKKQKMLDTYEKLTNHREEIERRN